MSLCGCDVRVQLRHAGAHVLKCLLHLHTCMHNKPKGSCRAVAIEYDAPSCFARGHTPHRLCFSPFGIVSLVFACAAGTALNGHLGDVLFLSACLFFSLATMRLSLHAPQHEAIQLAASKKVTLGVLSLAWLALGEGGSRFVCIVR